MRTRFDKELEELNREILKMGMAVEKSIEKAIGIIENRDEEIALEVKNLEQEIDNMEYSILNLCLRLILEQQPVAIDLRNISAAMKIITDMERIGDQAKDISEIALLLKGEDKLKSREHILIMASHVIQMGKDSIASFVDRDKEKAKEVIKYDDIVDNYFIQVRDDLIEAIKKEKLDPANIIDHIMIAKYLERIGDHFVNIANWVIFIVEG